MFLWEKIKLLLILMGVELYNVYKCYAVFNTVKYLFLNLRFESSVKSYDTKTKHCKLFRIVGLRVV